MKGSINKHICENEVVFRHKTMYLILKIIANGLNENKFPLQMIVLVIDKKMVNWKSYKAHKYIQSLLLYPIAANSFFRTPKSAKLQKYDLIELILSHTNLSMLSIH